MVACAFWLYSLGIECEVATVRPRVNPPSRRKNVGFKGGTTDSFTRYGSRTPYAMRNGFLLEMPGCLRDAARNLVGAAACA